MRVLADLEDVRQVFAGWNDPIAWVGKTHLLCRGIGSYISDFWVIPESRAGITLCETAGFTYVPFEEAASRLGRGGLDVLCLLPREELTDLCLRSGWRLLSASARTIHEAADKLLLPALLSRARVPVIPHILVDRMGSQTPQAIWDGLGSTRLVVQTAENDRTGRGTFQVSSLQELKEVMQALGHRPFKAVRFMEGRLLTISACATSRGTYTGRFSRQLVGIPLLTECWSAHCGNECLAEEALGAAEITAIRRCCCRVGGELVRQGFVGHFGLDLVLDDAGNPWVFEINPRLQSVSSLVHVAEIEQGCVPLQAIHILELAGRSFRVGQAGSMSHVCLHSQVVVEHCGAKIVALESPGCGVYQRDGDRLSRISAVGDLHSLRFGQFLITPFCVPGQRMEAGDRIAVVQWRGSVADEHGKLLEDVAETVRILRRRVEGHRGQ